MDQMFIKDLSVRCIIGTKPEERIVRQEVVINVALDCDLSKAGRSDRLADTLNFRRIEERIVKMTEASAFLLIERLADAIATICLEESAVKAVRVTIDKPRALRFARSAAVEICRRSPRARRRG